MAAATGGGACARPVPGSFRRRPARLRMLAVDRELLPTRGYESLKVVDVIAAAQVSRTTFYAHFSGKRECVTEAVDPELAAIERRLREACAEGRPWAHSLLTAVDGALNDLFASELSPRARLLDAMHRSVGERGYVATRLVDVASSARVSRLELYRSFGSKQECFAAAYARQVARLEDKVRGADRNADECPAAARLVALGEILAAEPLTARVLLLEAGRLPADPVDPTSAGSSAFADLVERLLFGAPIEDAERQLQRRLGIGAVVETLRSAVLAERLEHITDRLGRLATLAEGTVLKRQSA